MKKLFQLVLICIVLFSLNACSNDNDGKQIELPNKSEQTQQGYADEETTGGFTFKAQSAWIANVTEKITSRASSVSWLKLLLNGKETYSGDAGEFTLTIEMEPNYSGETRSATITITCGTDTISITVTQDGKTKDGEVPEEPEPEVPVTKYERYINKIEREDEEEIIYLIFDYDEKGQVIKLTEYNEDGSDYENIISYPDKNTIKIQSDDANASYTIPLNDDGYATSIINHTEKNEIMYTYKDGYAVNREERGSGYIQNFVWQSGNLVQMYDNDFSPIIEDYKYTNFPNNEKVNLDLNYLFMKEIEPFALFGWTGKRSKNYISTGYPWNGRVYNAYDGPEFSIRTEVTYQPLSYTFDEDGFVSTIMLSWTESRIKTIHATGKKETLSEETISELWRITYQK